jgi:hypothetical protein
MAENQFAASVRPFPSWGIRAVYYVDGKKYHHLDRALRRSAPLAVVCGLSDARNRAMMMLAIA